MSGFWQHQGDITIEKEKDEKRLLFVKDLARFENIFRAGKFPSLNSIKSNPHCMKISLQMASIIHYVS